MADNRVIAKTQSVGRTAPNVNNNYVAQSAFTDGSAFAADHGLLLATNGDIFVANGGIGSSPETFAGAFDANGPDFVIEVPDQTTIVLLAINILLQTVGTTLLNEVVAAVSTTAGAVGSAGTLVTPRNLRTGNSSTSGCTVNVAVDAAGSGTQSNPYEFIRQGFQLVEDMAATEDWQERTWNWAAKQSGIYPILDGVSSLFIHAAAQAGAGFISVTYAEFQTNEI